MTSIFHPSSDLHKGLWKPKTLLTNFVMPKGFKPQVTDTLYTEIDEDSPSDLDFIYL